MAALALAVGDVAFPHTAELRCAKKLAALLVFELVSSGNAASQREIKSWFCQLEGIYIASPPRPGSREDEKSLQER